MNITRRYYPVRLLGFALVALGMLLHAYIAFVKASSGALFFSIGLMIWSWLPYILALTLLLLLRNPIMPLIGVLGPLYFDMQSYYTAFIAPQSSTAALILLWVPLWNLIIIEPIGLLIGWPIGWMASKLLTPGKKRLEPSS
jgi:hypothetical protein